MVAPRVRHARPGGIRFYEGDPGLGIVLVPIGAGLLLVAVVLVARGLATAGVSANDSKKT